MNSFLSTSRGGTDLGMKASKAVWLRCSTAHILVIGVNGDAFTADVVDSVQLNCFSVTV